MTIKSMNRLSVVAILSFSTLASAKSPDVLVGRLSRSQVEQSVAMWDEDVPVVGDLWHTRVDEMKRVEPGATIKVFFGTWCPDSRQEVPQFMRILHALGDRAPFTVQFFGVDERKEQPTHELVSNRIWYLPTFVVSRNGREVGRIVQQPARSLDKDLLRLLNGTAHGFLSSNENAIVRHLNGHPSTSAFP